MALGLNEGMTTKDLAEIRFAEQVEKHLGRPLTNDEAQWDIWEIRDGAGYNAKEVAGELVANENSK